MSAEEMKERLEGIGVKVSLEKPPASTQWNAKITVTSDMTNAGAAAGMSFEATDKDPETAMKRAMKKVKQVTAKAQTAGPHRYRG